MVCSRTVQERLLQAINVPGAGVGQGQPQPRPMARPSENRA